MPHLSQKERTLLEDQKSHEELCIKKYGNYAEQAKDPQAKEMFFRHQSQEREHLNTINQILAGQVPMMNQSQGQGQQQQQGSGNQSMQQTMQESKTGLTNQTDIDLCSDMLATEKYVSHTYDTAIFEFRDPNIRNALNHIQKEEQQHGEELFKYMQSKGGYNVQASS